MEPISSSVTARSTALQTPVPAQQRQDREAISAPQARSDSYSNSSPLQELQLQRRQVVEDLGKSQKVEAQLQDASDQLKSGKAVADQAGRGDASGTEKQQLQQAFSKVSSNLNTLADKVEKSTGSTATSAPLRVSGNVNSPEEARETSRSLDKALESVEAGLGAISQSQAQQTYPRTATSDSTTPPIQNQAEAQARAQQVQSQIQKQPDNALNSQATVGKQTALTLFQ